ncbi:hypothetical protein [Streptomyces tsukubensis]|uniref:Lipoprotein n=1 Tax=Streptomyces tsukubensis TaxID=83656 RepID=A0A1V3ZZE0_9ACTN|nr:hypothetical protein [Streptomyces tsukubensis]OON71584.1 hypothetical protein B1H18_33265 [Streptomyces tsukubensis]QFR93240.1 hypothetical protein GBW32_09260 [Streptomyces tsukubensis]
MKSLLVKAVAGVATAVALTACSEKAAAPARAAGGPSVTLCERLSRLDIDNSALGSLDPYEASPEQFSGGYADVARDWAEVKDVLAPLPAARRTALRTAAEGLADTYGGLPGDIPGGEGLEAIGGRMAELRTALAAATSGLKCP